MQRSTTYTQQKEKVCQYLLETCKANTLKHGGTTLWRHLNAVGLLLENANVADDVCLAGYMHSVYGTEFFKTTAVDLSQRQVIASLIGEHAEHIVYTFCGTHRLGYLQPWLTSRTLKPPTWRAEFTPELSIEEHFDKYIDAIAAVEYANLLDQNVLWRNRWMLPVGTQYNILKLGSQTSLEDTIYTNTQQVISQGLENSKKSCITVLVQKINGIRASNLSIDAQLLGSHLVYPDKLAQAQELLTNAGNKLASADYTLLEHYAACEQLSLIDAASAIVYKALLDAKCLSQTEQFKDQMFAAIKLAKTHKELSNYTETIEKYTL